MTGRAVDPSGMRGRFIAEALAFIDRAGGIHGANLRGISRAIGCAHTNAYNHFASLDDLLWGALAEALERLVAHTLEATAGRSATLAAFIGSQVDFALAHPGWYRLVWLEVLPGQPPAELLPALERPGRIFAEQLSRVAPGQRTPRQLEEEAELIHTYLHGAICKAIAARPAPPEPAALRRRLTRNVGRLLELAAHDRRTA